MDLIQQDSTMDNQKFELALVPDVLELRYNSVPPSSGHNNQHNPMIRLPLRVKQLP